MAPTTRGKKQRAPTASARQEAVADVDARANPEDDGAADNVEEGSHSHYANHVARPTSEGESREPTSQDDDDEDTAPSLAASINQGRGYKDGRPSYHETSSSDESEEEGRRKRTPRFTMSARRMLEVEREQLKREREDFNRDMETRMQRLEEERRLMQDEMNRRWQELLLQSTNKVNTPSTPLPPTRIGREECDGSRSIAHDASAPLPTTRISREECDGPRGTARDASPADSQQPRAGASDTVSAKTQGPDQEWELVRRTVNTLQDALQLATKRGKFPSMTPPAQAITSQPHSHSPRQYSSPASASSSTSGSSLADHFTTLLNMQRAPAIELRQFSGNVLDYPRFRASVKECIEKHIQPGDGRLQRLLKALTGEALTTIGNADLMGDVEGFEVAMERLHRRYGRREDLAYEWLGRLEQFKSDSCREWADQLRCCVDALLATQSLDRMGYGRELNSVVSRMPKKIRNGFAAALTSARERNAPQPGFKDLLRIAEKEGESETDRAIFEPSTGANRREGSYHRRHHQGPKPKTATARVLAVEASPANTASSLPSDTESCPVCNGHHQIERCPEYTRADLGQRRSLAGKLRLCYACLRTGHGVRNCEARCDDCQRAHHVTLHRGDTAPNPRKRQASSPAPAPHGKRRRSQKYQKSNKGQGQSNGKAPTQGKEQAPQQDPPRNIVLKTGSDQA